MIDFTQIIMVLMLIGCALYIYWLHHTYNISLMEKKPISNVVKKPKKVVISEDDEISILKSKYDPDNNTAKDNDSLFTE